MHHFATLIGYGASAVNPYLLLETLDQLVIEGRIAKEHPDGTREVVSAEQAAQNVVKAIGKGLLKTISKMGISTIQSYRGAQIFEAVGLEPELIDAHFTGTASRIGGVGMAVLAREALERHARAFPGGEGLLPVGGVYAWRRGGERHMWNPETISLVQQAVRAPLGELGPALAGDAQALATVRESPHSSSTAGTRRRRTSTPPAARRCAGCCASPGAASPYRSRRSSRPARSCAASARAR